MFRLNRSHPYLKLEKSVHHWRALADRIQLRAFYPWPSDDLEDFSWQANGKPAWISRNCQE
jgi:hypothetical protein